MFELKLSGSDSIENISKACSHKPTILSRPGLTFTSNFCSGISQARTSLQEDDQSEPRGSPTPDQWTVTSSDEPCWTTDLCLQQYLQDFIYQGKQVTVGSIVHTSSAQVSTPVASLTWILTVWTIARFYIEDGEK